VQRFLWRVTYTYSDGTSSHEAVCVRAADGDEAAARTEVEAATSRYLQASRATRTITLTVVTADV
jgi:hypothetical protein